MNKKSLKPYIINAFYTWAIDVGYSPIIEITKSDNNDLPDFIKNKPVFNLNIHPSSIRSMVFNKENIILEAFFKNNAFILKIDYQSISKIFNDEDGYGLEFDINDFEKNSDTLKENYFINENALGQTKIPKLQLIKKNKE